jgi:hypothetical protein
MKAKPPNWFSVVLLAITLLFTVGALGFTARARVIPLAVAAPTLFLLSIQVIREVYPNILSKFIKTGTENKISHQTHDILSRYRETNPSEKKKDPGIDIIIVTMHLVTIFLLMLLGGIIPGGMIYIALYYRFIARAGWAVSTSAAIIVGVICYALFGILLEAEIWAGIFSL